MTATVTLGPTTAERFWRYVQVGEGDGCWLWTGYTIGEYGSLWNDGRMEYAHRLSWLIHGGALLDGVKVLHKCDTPPCVRFDHLFTGTQVDNMQDCKAKGRLRPPPARLGLDNVNGKLTEVEIEEIRVALADGESQRAVATRFGVTQSTVWRWAHA